MHRVAGNAVMWSIGAFEPDAASLHAMNTLQMQMVVWAMGVKRRPGESWLEHRLRAWRLARQAIHQHLAERWSTSWLGRYWVYNGHRCRSGSWESPPASGLLDSYRDCERWQQQQADKRGKGICPDSSRGCCPTRRETWMLLLAAPGVDWLRTRRHGGLGLMSGLHKGMFPGPRDGSGR